MFLDKWSEIRAFVQRAEALGFDGCWANDHPNRLMDCWTTLSALALATERIRLISLVSCVYYRSPYLLARQAADVDRRKLNRLKEFCAEIGRPYDSVVRSHYSPLLTLAADEDKLAEKKRRARIPDADLHAVPLFATPAQAISHYQALSDAGVQFFLCLINGRDDETVDLLAEVVIPAIKPARSAA